MANETEEQYQDRLRKAAIMSAPRWTEFEYKTSREWRRFESPYSPSWNWELADYRIKPKREIIDDEVYLFWREYDEDNITPHILLGERIKQSYSSKEYVFCYALPYADYKHLRNTPIKDIPDDVVEKARMN